jgi:hypothetical protein
MQAEAGGGLGGYRSTASALNSYRSRQGVGLDITALPGECGGVGVECRLVQPF